MSTRDLLEDRVAAALQNVADATIIPPMPVATSATVRRRRRSPFLVLGATVALVAASYGGAVAGGVTDGPSAFWGFNAKPETASLLATFPGPGVTIKTEIAAGHDRQQCISFQVLPADPNGQSTRGGGCAQFDPNRFGHNETSVCCDRSATGILYTLFVRSAGEATRATLEQSGSARPLLVTKGWIFGWADSQRPFTVTGYDAKDAVVGTFTGTPEPPPTEQGGEQTQNEKPSGHIVCHTPAECHPTPKTSSS